MPAIVKTTTDADPSTPALTTPEKENQEEQVTALEYVVARFGYTRADYEGEEKDAEYLLKYVPEKECFKAGRAGGVSLDRYGLYEVATLYRRAGDEIRSSWNNAYHESDLVERDINRQIQRRGDDYATSIAASELEDGVKKALALADPQALRAQRKAFSSYGRVPSFAYTPERIRQEAKGKGWDQWEYAHEDFLKYHWFRMAMFSTRSSEQERYQELHEQSGRARKAFARMPHGISGRTMASAVDHLGETPEPPERRLTWIALSCGREDLAVAIQRATDYELRKAKRRYREVQSGVTGLPESDFYTHSEDAAVSMVRWISDAQGAGEDLAPTRQTSIVNWVERSARYHRDLRQEERQQRSKEVLQEAPYQTGLRPQDVPEGAEALTRPVDVVQEGEDMQHCVSGYASRVTEGTSMFFHYEHQGQEATVQVSKMGDPFSSGDDEQWTVRQTRGPSNRRNAASRKAEQVFGRWLAQGPTILPPKIEIAPAKAPENNLPERRRLATELSS
jgi:hypothetical protein